MTKIEKLKEYIMLNSKIFPIVQGPSPFDEYGRYIIPKEVTQEEITKFQDLQAELFNN